ncbi:hypothetical protein BJ994_001814 [Arthrobacter pigmenti]|uniref:Uncharacterized protein n=1 Tax=Arthrobacter pigmenti TaxID=271432 RepID=A0A846RHM1_9MICC|nr:S-layer homology domain-containing protein [Arthrobacter pigmenti]NJC22738.1 hypothetical protein [Arthrobacter pigmenti]
MASIVAAGAVCLPILVAPPAATAVEIAAVPGGSSLAAVGPIDSSNGYPLWYEDNGLASAGLDPLRLELCLEAIMCGAEIPNPNAPISLPENYPDEGFWWAAEAEIDRPIGDRALLVYAQEAAFGGAGGVAVGQQVAFSRQRIRIDSLNPNTSYKITTPYGVENIVTDVEGEINETQDIGCMSPPCGFELAMTGHIGPFLRWDPNQGQTAPEGYIGNPAIPHAVVGSPNNTNFFRIEGPNAGGPGVNSVETELFSVTGRIAQLRATVDQPGDLFGAATDVYVQPSFPKEADIVYTLDGTEPTLTNGTRVATDGKPGFAATVTIPAAAPDAVDDLGNPTTIRHTTLKYFAVDANGGVSETYTQQYTVDTSLPTVTATPDGLSEAPVNGRIVLQGAQTVTLTATDPLGGADPDIFYTTDGTRPTVDVDGNPVGSTKEYSDPVELRTSTVLNTLAVSDQGLVGPNSKYNYVVYNIKEVGPKGNHGFPEYLTDWNGQKLALCLDDPACGLEAPFDTELAQFPTSFPGESFWWSAGAEIPVTGGGRARLVLAMEAAFANEVPKEGDQVMFGRTRYSMRGLEPGATYRITQPYGVDVMTADPEDEDGELAYTADIGCLDAACSPDLLKESQIGPFLKSTLAPDGYLGDGATEAPVTGSPFDTNFFKLEQLTDANGVEFDVPRLIGQTNNFVVVGRLFDTPAPERRPATPVAPALNIAAARIGEAQLQLTPPADGGTPITGFEIRVTDQNGTQVGELIEAPADATTVKITGLPADQDHRFQVAARNAKGVSAFSPVSALLPALAPPFPDIPHKTVFFTEIAWLAGEEITLGYDDGKFQPLWQVKRDVMAAFLYRLAGEPAWNAPTVSPFKDVKPGDHFYKEITWLANEGITTGWDDGTFRPLVSVNRDMMAAFLYRMADVQEYTPPAVNPFPDVSTAKPFYKEIQWLAETKITTGFEDKTFKPLHAVNRDMMAAFLYRFDGQGFLD